MAYSPTGIPRVGLGNSGGGRGKVRSYQQHGGRYSVTLTVVTASELEDDDDMPYNAVALALDGATNAWNMPSDWTGKGAVWLYYNTVLKLPIANAGYPPQYTINYTTKILTGQFTDPDTGASIAALPATTTVVNPNTGATTYPNNTLTLYYQQSSAT